MATLPRQRAASPPPPPAASVESLAPYVLWTLLAAGLGELLLYRMLSRVGVHIPKQGLVLDAYDALVRLGSFAFNVSSVMAFAALALLAYAAARRWREKEGLGPAAAMLMGVLAAASLLLVFVQEGESTKLAYGALATGIMLLLSGHAWTDREVDVPRRAFITLIVAAYLAAQYYVLANQAYRALGLAAAPPATALALEVAEAMVVANALLAFWVWSGVRTGRRWRPSRAQLLAAGLAILVFAAAYGGEDASTASILSLWTLGLTLYLPLPLYVLALAAYGAAIVACLGRARHEPAALWDAAALGLLPVAGLALEMTYQHLIAVVALLLLLGAPRQVSALPEAAESRS